MHPLLTELLEVVPGERAVACRPLAPPPELDDGSGRFPAAIELELLAAVGAVLHPERILLAMRAVELRARDRRFPPRCRLRLQALAGEDGVVEVQADVETPAGVRFPVGVAQLVFGHVFPPAPSVSSERHAALERRGQGDNAAALYRPGPERPFAVPAALQLVSWARLGGLGQMLGGLGGPGGSPGPGSGWGAAQLQTAPLQLEAALQLARWLWYGFAGEAFVPSTMEGATWYRLPRQGEPLLAEAVLRGSRAGQPLFDVNLFGSERLPIVELRGVSGPTPTLAPAAPGPRLAWEEFLRLVSCREESPS